MKNQIKIVIAEAQPIFRTGLRQLLETVPEFNIVGEVGEGEAALEVIADAKPDVAVLCISLPIKDGLEVARTVFARSLPVEVIFLTIKKSESCFNAAMDLGVKGYVLKNTARSDLVDAVKEVSDGKCYISPVMSTFLVDRNRRQKSFEQTIPAVSGLTPCEKRILTLVAKYMTNKEIAAELFISVRTVEHHREHISAKLSLRGTHALLKFAVEYTNELA